MGVPAVVEPPPGNPRFPLIDSMRAVAALSVFVLHAGVFSQANLTARYGEFTARLDIGVTIFFLISGFLLYRPFVAARIAGARRPRAALYLRRRALRILPAYWLAVVCLAIYPGLPGFWGPDWWRPFVFANEFSITAPAAGLPQAWSLAVEVCFYLALPAIAFGISRPLFGRDRRSRIRSEAVLLGLLWLGSVAFRLAVSGGGVPLVKATLATGALTPDLPPVYTLIPRSAYSSLLGTFDWFALGMALALVSAAVYDRVDRPRLVRWVERAPSACWLLALVLFVGSPLVGLIPRFPHPYGAAQWFYGHAMYGVVALLLLAPAVFGGDHRGLPRRILRNPVLAWLGLVSYGIFLWHVTILFELDRNGPGVVRDHPMLVGGGVGLAITVAAAAASYYLVERPILRFKRERGQR